MYPKVHTKAFIVHSEPRGESDRLVWMYTKDFGMVVAKVQGARKNENKHRMALKDFGFVFVDLLRGRDIWRVTSAEEIQPLSSFEKSTQNTIVQLAKLVRRFCVGEEENQRLFELLEYVFEHGNTDFESKSFEIAVMIEFLATLGYWEEEFEGEVMGRSLVEEVAKDTKAYVLKINSSLQATHM